MTLYLQWPQIIWIALALTGLGVHAFKHGRAEKITFSVWKRMVNIALTAALLSWGGFFGPAPQLPQVQQGALR
jgi:hypothetical protein